MIKKISFFPFVLLVIGSIDNIRNLPSSALFGSSAIFFFLFGAIFFLVPTALISAQLAAAFPTARGGVYHWVKSALGEKAGVTAIWLQWINTMVWYPAILSFIGGSIAYLVNPDLAASPFYLLIVILVLFWSFTAVNLFGIRVSSGINTLCTMIGTIFPLLLLIGLGVFWTASGHPIQIQFSSSEILPSFQSSSTWVSLISVMASFLGMELSGVHVNDIENPQKNFPKGVLIAGLFILFSMLFGSLAIGAILPKQDINLVSGVLQSFTFLLAALDLSGYVPLLTLLIIIGSVGNMINWLISPAKGLLHAAENGFLPSFFTKTNRFGVPSRVLLLQAILVSVFTSLFLLVESVNVLYWFFTALSTGLYMMMYMLLFIAAIKLDFIERQEKASFKIPFGKTGLLSVCCCGLCGCLLTLIVGCFPPESLYISSNFEYGCLFVLGLVLFVSPVALLFFQQKRAKKSTKMKGPLEHVSVSENHSLSELYDR
jgi:glutamate:GABA antiporter